MPGSRYLLDTNAVVALLQGNDDLARLCHGAEWLAISVITVLEFNGFAALSEEDSHLFRQFAERVTVVDLAQGNRDLMNLIISLRKGHHAKLPDAIVLASAVLNSAELVTNDLQLLRLHDSLPGFKVRGFVLAA